ncbi:hypothetical protein Tco_0627964 [Tanacetum coccineum]|uniref:SMP domain-containing protein n=1 Tax=Tanacetum coccineum TaxID=301880 RepID=A0ABQ4WNW7_9ASTR
MVGCTIASGPYMIYMQHDNDVKLDERKRILKEMAPKRATRSTPVTENPTTTTVTNAQLQAMIDQGVTAALAARDANRNGDDSHTSLFAKTNY